MITDKTFPISTMVTVNGIDIEVFESGTENKGNPIVLCHGWPEHAYSWRFQIPALVNAGFHVIVPNQRGYGQSSCPDEVTAYDIVHLTGDLAGLLDHYGYEDAVFIGHDWGAMVVWSMALLHPQRVKRLINLSLPYQERGDIPWIEMMEQFLGGDYYFVHFNRQPGVADEVLNRHTSQFLSNLFRKNLPMEMPAPGMAMINLAEADRPKGDPIMSEADLNVFISSFQKNGFTSSINWYRNLDRNWHLLADVDPIIQCPALMIYGDRDVIPKSETMINFVPNLETASLDCGHWITQEMPDETNDLILSWLVKGTADLPTDSLAVS